MRRAWSYVSLAAFGAGAVALGTALAAGGCSTTPDAQAVRSLEGSAQTSFVCLAKPGTDNVFHPLGDCTHTTADTITSFGDDGATPHLYALVTQTTRGEVAMVDVSTTAGDVLDEDPSTPGANFIPVGIDPSSIVSTPKGTASFVASADITRPMLYALPTSRLRPCEIDDAQCDKAAPTLSTWPACQLPAPPGRMVMVADAAVDGTTRHTCGGAYEPVDPTTSPRGNIDSEALGREKLIVAIPTLHELVVLDAQTVLDADAGSISPCTIEKTIPLDEVVAPPEPPMAPTTTQACVNPDEKPPAAIGTAASQPSGLTVEDGKLYVADYARPLIHVLSVRSVCDAALEDPFVATSVVDPSRVVVTSEVAVSPLLPTFKRYLYAIDVEDRSVMVFDASAAPMQRTPLANPNPEWNPLQPADRIRFGAAPTSLSVIQRDVPKSDPATGTAPFGVRCDPNPKLTVCTGAGTCDLSTSYRTSTDYTVGAGPLTLRGTFAMISLSSGQISVLDVDDYDAACRGPNDQSALLGCSGTLQSGLDTSSEGSCGTVVPNEARSANYVISNTEAGRHLGGLQALPILQNKEGDVIPPGDGVPRLHAVLPKTGNAVLSVNGEATAINSDGLVDDPDGARDALLMNLEDPRAQVVDQEWTVTYEGALPGFSGHVGELHLDQGERTLVDQSGTFCASGVQSQASIRGILAAQGVSGPELAAESEGFADRLQITNALIDQENTYYETSGCSFLDCRNTFGDDTSPTLSRDFIIREAYDTNLELGDPPAGAALTKCCFPSVVNFAVRPGNQWTVVGAISGFFHHVITSPDTHACRDSCDPKFERMNGRVRATKDPVLADDAPTAFINPMFRFAITSGGGEPRDEQFRFQTEGAFQPLRVTLTDDRVRPNVLVRSLTYVPSIDAFVMTDGALEGLLILAGDLLSDPKQIY